jgi:hypothetical protein
MIDDARDSHLSSPKAANQHGILAYPNSIINEVFLSQSCNSVNNVDSWNKPETP